MISDEETDASVRARLRSGRRFAIWVAVVPAATFIWGVIAASRVQLDGQIYDEVRVLLIGVVFVVCLALWGIFYAAAGSSRERQARGFEVLPPRRDGEA